MTDFWRVVNIVIVIIVIVLFIKFKGRKNKTPASQNLLNLKELNNRKQTLSNELQAYENDINQFETASRQMVDEYFAEQEAHVKELVNVEINTALDAMEAGLQAELQQGFNDAKTKLEK